MLKGLERKRIAKTLSKGINLDPLPLRSSWGLCL